jgi:arginase
MIDSIAVPWHLGVEDLGIGAGPRRLLAETGAQSRFVEPPTEATEVGRMFELQRNVAGLVREALEAGRAPLVLSGECNPAVGTISALRGAGRVGVIWLDAHADMNTPETTESGFVDGMALAMVTGRCWRALCRRTPGWQPLSDRDVLLAGHRALDPAERAELDRSAIAELPTDRFDRFGDAVADLAAGVDALYVHVDLDVLDASEARANDWAVAGGPALSELLAAVGSAAQTGKLRAGALTAYDPAADDTPRTSRAAVTLLAALRDALSR